MFRGATHLSLDDKGRIAIPAKYREEIITSCDGCLMTTVGPDHCLMVYPLPEWEVIEQALMLRPNMDKQVRRMQRLLVGHAQECDMSAQGRISIPALLREFAGLDKQVTLVGQGKKFELWNTQSWQENRELWLKKEDELEGFSEILDSMVF